MAYNHVEIKAFNGLYLNQNSFDVPDGALEQAENCVISKDNVIEKRKGFYTFLTPAGGSTLNNLYNYQNKLIALYNSKIQWVNDSGVGTTLTGETVSLSSPRIGRFTDANTNLYFTSDDGIMKLESYQSAVFKAGVPPGLDLRGKFAAANGPIEEAELLTADSLGPGKQVNYRIVFGRRDANNNLLLGAPSDVLTLINRTTEGATWSRTGTTITVTTASAHNLSTGMVVTVIDTVAGDVSTIEGDFIITVASATTFTYTSGSGAASGTLKFTTSRNVNLEGTIPSEITSTDYFYQVYRSSQVAAPSTTNPDIVAPLDFKLLQEVQLTTADLAAEMFFFLDNIDSLFLGAELYTNPNSQEGELQANNLPPLADDLALYRNYVIYGNTTSLHLLDLALTNSSATFINAADYIEVKVGGTTRRYVARGGVGNSTVAASSVSGTGTLTITYTAHGFSNGDTVYVSNVSGGAFAVGTYTVAGVAANTFQITGSGTATALDFQGVTNGTYPIFTLLSAAASTISTGIDTTARALVKAINRDTACPVYARYASLANDIPGKLYLQAKEFAGQIEVRANTTAVGQAFTPNLPASFNGSVVSKSDVLPNNLFFSKLGEPEAVPFSNSLPVGSRNKGILRIFALRDSLIILKEDGVYRLDGDSPGNFSVTPIDTTVLCVAANSAAVLNNQVIFLSNQGVAMVSNSSVQIISHRIEDPLTPIYTSPNLIAQTAGVAYESARLYLLTTLKPNTSTASTVWCYNTLQDAWTTWDRYFKAGTVGPNDTLFLVSSGNTLWKQRKLHNRSDYGEESYSITVTAVAAGNLSASFIVADYNPTPGDMIIYDGIISIIRSASFADGVWTVGFDSQTNLIPAAVAAVLYESFPAVIKFAPFTGGQTNRMKQFSQMTIRPRDNSISALDINFTTDAFGGSEITEWRSVNVAQSLGWGLFPWGFDAWGQAYGINLNFQTTQATPVRIYVPLFSQRGSYIQAVLTHQTAGEPLNIQAVGYQVRGYGERIST